MFSSKAIKSLSRKLFQTRPLPATALAAAEVLPATEPVEEERTPCYRAKQFYPVKLNETLNGRYQIASKLGFGTCSTVWLARDLQRLRWLSPRFVAVKINIKNFASKEDADHELRIMERVTNANSGHKGRPYVRTLLDSFDLQGPDGNHVCMVSEVLREPLWILKQRCQGNVIPLDLLKLITEGVLRGLDYLHSECHIIHTDLKSDNILIALTDKSMLAGIAQDERIAPLPQKKVEERTIYLARNCFDMDLGGFGNPIITDYGTSVFGDRRDLFYHLIHPDGYRAPEVTLGAGWSYPADMWNLGMMIWTLLEGSTPLDRPDCKTTKYTSEGHLARIISLLGSPPLDFLEHCQQRAEYFDDDGPNLMNPPLFNRRNNFHCTEREKFVCFIKKILCWRPTDRIIPADLLSDPWLDDSE